MNTRPPHAPITHAPITHAMILAAGLGTRMRPLTDGRPKPLIEVGGRTLIDHILDRLADAGVSETVVNVHYMADMMRAHLAPRARPHVTISDETDRLMDSGGGIVKALPSLGGGAFITVNADSLWTEGPVPNLERMIAGFDETRMDALMMLAPMDRCSGFDGRGDFLMDEAGRLARRPREGTAPFAWAGVQIVSPRLFAAAPEGPFSTNLLWDRAIAEGRLYGLVMSGFWMHVGTPEGRDQAEARLAAAQALAP